MNTILPAKRVIAITISPPTRVKISKRSGMDKEELRERYDKDTRLIQKSLNRSSNEYAIYPEFDDKGRLHYHGIVTVKSNVSFKLETIPMLGEHLGFVLVKENPDNKWKEYMLKEWLDTQLILDIENPITYTDLRTVVRKRQPKQTMKEIKNTPPVPVWYEFNEKTKLFEETHATTS